jgi:hypothetical protein
MVSQFQWPVAVASLRSIHQLFESGKPELMFEIPRLSADPHTSCHQIPRCFGLRPNSPAETAETSSGQELVSLQITSAGAEIPEYQSHTSR